MWAIKNLFIEKLARTFDNRDKEEASQIFHSYTICALCLQKNWHREDTKAMELLSLHYDFKMPRKTQFSWGILLFFPQRKVTKMTREIKQKVETTAQTFTEKNIQPEHPYWANICPSNRTVCRWNSQLGSRVVMRGGERETICHRWVTLGSRERGLLSLLETHTYMYCLCLFLTHSSWHIPSHAYTHWDNTAGGKAKGYRLLHIYK